MTIFLAIVCFSMLFVASLFFLLFCVHVKNLMKREKKIESWDILFGLILFSLSLIPTAIATIFIAIGLFN